MKSPLVSIVINCYNSERFLDKALKSISLKTYSQSQIFSNPINKKYFEELPSWTWIKNREINISSSEIRKQRKKLRGSY